MAQRTARDPEEAYAGKYLGAREFVASDDLLRSYFEGLKIDPARYTDASPYGQPVAPSLILTSAETGFSGGGFKNNFGTLWIRQQWDLWQPVFPDQQYSVTSRVVDVYDWRDRTVANQQATLWSPEGRMMAQGHHHQSYLLDQSEGRVKLRDPKSKEGARRFEPPQGEEIESVSRTITLEMCGEFFHGNKNYHTDRKAAEDLGFEDVVVGGRMTMSYIGDIMDRRFGRGWYEGGKLDIKFTNIVWPGDRVTVRGVITDRASEDGGTRASVAVWMEKDDGTVVIVGAASALE